MDDQPDDFEEMLAGYDRIIHDKALQQDLVDAGLLVRTEPREGGRSAGNSTPSPDTVTGMTPVDDLSHPWWSWDTEDDDNWLTEFNGDDIRALVRERNALLDRLAAAEGQREARHRQADELGHGTDGLMFHEATCPHCGLMLAYLVRDQVECPYAAVNDYDDWVAALKEQPR